MIREQWDGAEWQAHCRRLLGTRYQEHEIQFIPDRDRGDGGLEAYLFAGVGYQCYSPQDCYSTETQLEAQKGKIRDDIRKLVSQPEQTRKLLGEVVLHRWVLMTPEFDSRRLIEYARTKSQTTRRLSPRPFWCAPDFEIVVCSDEEFSFERAALVTQAAATVRINCQDPTDAEVYGSIGEGAAEALTAKLRVDPHLAGDVEALEAFRGELLGVWVRGRRQMDELASDYAEVHDRVRVFFREVRRSITMSRFTGPSGAALLDTLVRESSERLRAEIPTLSITLCRELAWSHVAEFFIECPLEFRPPAAVR